MKRSFLFGWLWGFLILATSQSEVGRLEDDQNNRTATYNNISSESDDAAPATLQDEPDQLIMEEEEAPSVPSMDRNSRQQDTVMSEGGSVHSTATSSASSAEDSLSDSSTSEAEGGVRISKKEVLPKELASDNASQDEPEILPPESEFQAVDDARGEETTSSTGMLDDEDEQQQKLQKQNNEARNEESIHRDSRNQQQQRIQMQPMGHQIPAENVQYYDEEIQIEEERDQDSSSRRSGGSIDDRSPKATDAVKEATHQEDERVHAARTGRVLKNEEIRMERAANDGSTHEETIPDTINGEEFLVPLRLEEQKMASATHTANDDNSAKETHAEHFDDRTLLDMFGEAAKEYLTQKLIPHTDVECRWDWRSLKCEPACHCALQFQSGDYHLGRSCRKRIEPLSICQPTVFIQDHVAVKRFLSLCQQTTDIVQGKVRHTVGGLVESTKRRYESFQDGVCHNVKEALEGTYEQAGGGCWNTLPQTSIPEKVFCRDYIDSFPTCDDDDDNGGFPQPFPRPPIGGAAGVGGNENAALPPTSVAASAAAAAAARNRREMRRERIFADLYERDF